MEEPHPGLRAERPKAVNTEAASRKSSGRSGRRVLVVQADPTAQQLCRQALERAGFLVDAVDSGVAAVMAARESKPDLIVMDLQLRDVAGREAIGWLRSNSALRSTPIVVLTTATDGDAESTTIGPGMSLRKPVSPAVIQRIVGELLGELPSSAEE